MNMSKILIQDISMSFPDRTAARPKKGQTTSSIDVLDHIDLSVNEGEFVCIVGPSGCGKSTLLNIVGGFLKPTGGKVLIDHVPVIEPDRKRVFIFQENGVFPWLTVEENIAFGLFDKSEEERNRIVRHYVEMVGLNGFEKSYPREISGGMKQRVEIARALAPNPDVLYMDEPFGALDFLTRLRMRTELTQIWEREKKTILFVTHDVEESVQLASRVVVMSRRPATINTIIDVNLARPRDLDDPEYLRIRDEIFEVMGLDHSGLSAGKGLAAETKARPAVALSTRRHKLSADVIIIGGGPAGAALGSYLGRAAIDHLIIDKDHHPRAHVGESLSYSATRILKEIDFLPVLEAGDFIVRGGMSWVPWYSTEQIDLDFRKLGNVESAYQVNRANFDNLLLQHARGSGSKVLTGAEVTHVEFDRNDYAVGVGVKLGDSRTTLKCRIVADASGRQAIIGRQAKLLKPDPDFFQFAVHGWFRNVDRGHQSTSNFTHIYLLPIKRGWAWQIPINDQITSIGIVTDRDRFIKSGEEADNFFKRTIALNPVFASRMGDAELVGEFRKEGNYSYLLDQFAGNGWVALGDAAYFVDPIFSSGVSEALHSAKYAADVICNSVTSEKPSSEEFRNYELALSQSAGIWKRFVGLFYDMAPVFGSVMATEEYREVVMRMCEGEIHGDLAETTLNALDKLAQELAVSSDHPLKKHLAQVQ